MAAVVTAFGINFKPPMYHEGDIIEIPLPDGRRAIGWILHISQHFKDAVGFVVFGIEGHVRNEDIATNPTISGLGPLYTNIKAIKHYGCKVVDNHPVTESKRNLTKRRVADGVYVADHYIGSVAELDAWGLKPMLVFGMPGVFAEIQKAFPSCTTSVDDI